MTTEFYTVPQSVAQAAASAAEAAASALGGNIISSGTLYLGDQNTDGSYRFRTAAGILYIETRIAGSWEELDVLNP